MKIDLGNGELELELSFWTLVVYEQEFGSSLIGDLFGKVELVDAEALSLNDEGNLVLDYREFNFTEGVKALWAAVRAANDDTPSFKTWAKSMHGVDLWPVVGEFAAEVRSELFRPGATDSE